METHIAFRKLSFDESCDEFLHTHQAPLTQSLMYALWHHNMGKVIHRYSIEINENSVKQIGYIQAIEVPLFLGKKYLYAPYGPVINPKYAHLVMPRIANEMRTIAKGINASFFRLDCTPTFLDTTPLLKKYFCKSPKKTYKGSAFQPRAEWVLDLRPNIESLLADIHTKTRYCIRTAEKRNCSVQIITENFKAHFDIFTSLMKETATRNGFNLHNESYYKSIFDILDTTHQGYLVTTTVAGTITNCMLFVRFGDTVMYIFGGSTTDQKNVPASHLALWHSIRHAKVLGAVFFNFGGISSDEHPNPSLANLTQFKMRFGGSLVRHSDFYDLIINRFIYVLFVLRKFFR